MQQSDRSLLWFCVVMCTLLAALAIIGLKQHVRPVADLRQHWQP